jgi:membrane protease YdiL (CAAX protease family)
MTKREYVHQAFDRGMVCIFPTEAAARAAAIDYVLYSERGALLSERAISFDTFRSLFLPRRKTHRPSNTLIRHLFVQSLIDQEIPLPSLINPAYPEASRRMIRPIARLLPTLLQIVSDSQLFDTLNQRRRDDIHLLYSLYLAFLDERELYEPEWELPVLPAQWDGSTTYCILYSDTIDRAQLLYEQLGSPPSIILSPTPSTVVTRLVVYPNHIQEIRAMIREIYRLLQEGMESSQIVIGCTAATVLVPVVEEEARRWGIPLSVREGRNPLQYPGGKFFTHLQRIYEERCSLESLKSLLLDPSIPFDEKQPIHRFLARAVRQSIFDGSLHGEDHYTQRLGDTSLVQWYTSLRNLIVGICEAKTPNALRRALNAFQQHLFIETQWKGRSGEEVYSYCLDTIAEVEQALEASRIESHDRLFSLLLSHLGSKRYVFQQQEAGVSVYAWPQVATIGAEHLFVIGLDQDGSRVLHRPLAFLDEEGEEYEIETTDALVITPIQTSSEEVLLRILPVRILQPDTLRSSWPVSIISALLFVLPHLSNRELSAGNSALVVVLYYALFALVITMCSLRLGGFELALGVHAANNLFVAIFVNYSGSSLPSTPLWTSLRPVGTIRDLLQLGITLLAIALLTVKLERTIALDQTPPMAHPSA